MEKKNRNVSIIKDTNGNNIVMINDIIFHGKRSIDWDDVEKYLKEHVGEFYMISESMDVIYFGSDLPDEYAHSKYSKEIKGALAKAKANAAQGLGEMIEIANNGSLKENKKKLYLQCRFNNEILTTGTKKT